MQLVEVIIEQSCLLSPCDENTTVSALASSVFSEWQSKNVKSFRKVKYVKDSCGRILPGHIQLSNLEVKNKFEIIIEELNEDNELDSSELLSRYRSYQLFTVRKILEHFMQINLSEAGENPKEDLLILLEELLKVPSQDIQMEILRNLNYLFTKFTGKKIIKFAIEQLISLFNSTIYVEVVISVLNCIYHSVTNLVNLFNINDILLLDIEKILIKFSKEEVPIISLYNNIKNLLSQITSNNQFITDQDIERLSHNNNNNNIKNSVMTTLPNHNPLRTNDITSCNNCITATGVAGTGAGAGNHNLARLLSLMNSNDSTIRLFGLKKFYDKISPQSTSAAVFPTNNNHNLMISNKEIENIFITLFQCLKLSLDSRAAKNLTMKNKASMHSSNPSLFILPPNRIYNTSTNCYLITAALQSELTCFDAITMLVKCLQILSCYTAYEEETAHEATVSKPPLPLPFAIHNQQHYYVLSKTISSYCLRYPTAALLVSCTFMRLVFTLANAYEDEIAETFAQLMYQTIQYYSSSSSDDAIGTKTDAHLHIESSGWSSFSLPVEEASIRYFLCYPLSPPSQYPLFQHRTRLALSYLLSISLAVRGNERESPSRHPTQARPSSGQATPSLDKWVSGSNGLILDKLLGLATAAAGVHWDCRLAALQLLGCCSVGKALQHRMEQLGAVAKLFGVLDALARETHWLAPRWPPDPSAGLAEHMLLLDMVVHDLQQAAHPPSLARYRGHSIRLIRGCLKLISNSIQLQPPARRQEVNEQLQRCRFSLFCPTAVAATTGDAPDTASGAVASVTLQQLATIDSVVKFYLELLAN